MPIEGLSIQGKRIVITRARDQASALREALEKLGATVIEIPTIEVRPPDSWEPLDRAIQKLDTFDYLIATSANGVAVFCDRFALAGGVERVKRLRVGAIGPATAREFERRGIRVDIVPSSFRAEGLLSALESEAVQGKSFLIPRALEARDVLPEGLRKRGARVEVVAAYRTVRPEFAPGELARRLSPLPDLLTFTSSSTARHFTEIVTGEHLRAKMDDVAVASIGPITSATLRELGWRVAVEAAEYTIRGLVRAASAYFDKYSAQGAGQ